MLAHFSLLGASWKHFAALVAFFAISGRFFRVLERWRLDLGVRGTHFPGSDPSFFYRFCIPACTRSLDARNATKPQFLQCFPLCAWFYVFRLASQKPTKKQQNATQRLLEHGFLPRKRVNSVLGRSRTDFREVWAFPKCLLGASWALPWKPPLFALGTVGHQFDA